MKTLTYCVGSNHDLLDAKRQDHHLTKIAKGEYGLVIAAPPCNTFSRARRLHDGGPMPVRSREEPWGKNVLNGQVQKDVNDANNLVLFSLKAIEAALRAKGADVKCLLEFPEDLGSFSDQGVVYHPASIWQLKQAKAMEASGAIRFAVNQCDLADVGYVKPTGILTNVKEFGNDSRFKEGWPVFTVQDGVHIYSGPLNGGGSKGKAPLIGKTKSGKYATAETAAYPPQMCSALSAILLMGIF